MYVTIYYTKSVPNFFPPLIFFIFLEKKMNLDLNNHLYPHFTEKEWGNCGILQGESVELFHTQCVSITHISL